MKKTPLWLLLIWPLTLFAAPAPEYWVIWDKANEINLQRIDHNSWSQFLKKYLTKDAQGNALLNYSGVSEADRESLERYILGLEHIDPRNFSKAVQEVYWINLYNALTVNLILDHYPVDSITDLGEGFFSFGPWDDPTANVSGIELTLNDIEHRILRPLWKDKRIHYAVNCASLGCPNLRGEAFDERKIESQLDASAREFINSDKGVNLQDATLRLSSIYDWYAVDFGSKASLFEHLEKFLDAGKAEQLSAFKGEIKYGYDWSLNEP